jgi:hypothetical protein
MNPLLTVAIPTHQRARYANFAIRALLAIEDPRLEVVVSDTSPADDLRRALAEGPIAPLSDGRLRYVRPAAPLDLTGNHNAAIEAATGEYVCLIGDDDTVVADALAVASWAAERDIDAVSPIIGANYVWPDFKTRFFGSRHASRLYFARKIRGEATMVDSPSALRKALSRAVQGTDDLPRLYHGIVRRSVIERARAHTGAYFHGTSPDVSGALAVAFFTRRFVSLDYPVTLPGAAGGSNTGRSAMNTHKGRMGSDPLTRIFLQEGWSSGVPRFFSVETVWGHAALATLNRLSPALAADFNYARLLATCRVLHPEYGEENARALSEAASLTGRDSRTFRRNVRTEMARYRRERALAILRRALSPTAAGGREFVDGLATIEEAPRHLHRYLARRGWSTATLTRALDLSLRPDVAPSRPAIP